MIPGPGVTVAAIDSTAIVETGDELSVWLLLSDGAIVAAYLPLPELLARAHTIAEGTPRAALRVVAPESHSPSAP